MNLEETKAEVMKCTKCDLYKTKTNYVFGSGSPTAKIIFIGEAPGKNEDIQGVPFCGRAGQIFEDLLTSIGLKRTDVYIANILKCRPPQNRQPAPFEIDRCVAFLDLQIENIKPKIICPMGNFAVGYIMKKYGIFEQKGISKLHGKIHKVRTVFDEITILPLYHPAVATYNPYMKDVLKKDIEVLKPLC